MALQSTIDPSIPYLTNLAGEHAGARCFSDISRACNYYLLRCCAQGPERPHANRTGVHGSFAVGRPLAAGMKRHRPGTTVYLERRATGSLADLHLHLHAGPLPVGRWLAVLAQLLYGRR